MNKRYSTIIFVFINTFFFLSTSLKAQNDSTLTMQPIGSEAFEVMRQFFNYDQDIPLEASIVERIDRHEYVREKIVFSGPGNSRVPGYLAIPKNGASPYPCVLQLHGIGSSKESWWEDNSFSLGGQLTKELLKSGFAVLSLDAEYHGERLANNDFESPEVFTFQKGWYLRTRDMVVQSVIEYRRAIDYLASRVEIDTSKLGIIGYSMGGMMTFNLTAVDPRIKVAVASVTPILKEQHSAMAAHNFASSITNQPFLMLMGNADKRNYTKVEARQLHDIIISNTKRLVFYESGHQLPSEWTKTATEWMEKYLK